MKINRSTQYALRATIQIAASDSPSPISSRELAVAGSMPERFLLQILRCLVRHGVLVSSRGVDGGYQLRRTPDNISLLDIIEAIEGPLDAESFVAECPSDDSEYLLDRSLQVVTQSLRTQLAAVTLSELLPTRTPDADQPVAVRSRDVVVGSPAA